MRLRRLWTLPIALVIAAGLTLGQATAAPAGSDGLRPDAPGSGSAAAPAGWGVTGLTDVGWSAQREVVVSPDGRRALVLADDGLRTLNITVDPAVVTGHNASITGYQLAVRPSGTMGYVGNGSTLYVVDHSGAQVRLVRALNGTLPSNARDLTVSANGKWLYVAYGGWTGNYGVRVYSLAKPKAPRQVAQFRSEPAPTAVALNHKGDRLTVGHSLVGSVQLVNVKNPKRPRKLGRPIEMPQSNSVSGATFNRGGTQIFVVGSDLDALHVVSWSKRAVVRTKTYPDQPTYGDGVEGITLDRNANRLALTFTGQEDNVTLAAINAADLSLQQVFSGVLYPTAPGISPAGPTRGRIYISTMRDFGDAPSRFVGAIPPA